MKYGRVLLTGGAGTLGQHILKSGLFGKILAPGRAELDITSTASVEKFFSQNGFDAIIHCAAMARVSECEKEPEKAIATNVIGTSNIVSAVIKKEKTMRFVHISTDGVYPSAKGNYSEDDATTPYNVYGWTKLGAECAVRALPNYCIIRTRFFDPKSIKYDEYAEDSYTSQIPAEELVKAIAKMLESWFIGVINIGGNRISDYELLRKYKPTIKPCKFAGIQEKSAVKLSKDASMDVSLWKKIQGQHK